MTHKLKYPRISFGIIVLNGEPFTRPNLRNIYEFAYEIVVAEGASYKASHIANKDGHSSDNTLEILKEFKTKEDPEDKIKIVTAEDEGYPNGFWPGEKTQQSQAYAKYCTGDYLWQLDIDEFYDKKDIIKIIDFLANFPKQSCYTVAAHNYFLSPYIKQTGSYFNHPCFQGEPWGRFRRIFSWGEGYTYFEHRPPTVIDSSNNIVHKHSTIDLTAKLNVRMHHYSTFSVEQWLNKIAYYRNQNWKYDNRTGLDMNQLLNSNKWRLITNQYSTINTLQAVDNQLDILVDIYDRYSDKATKDISKAIKTEIDKIKYRKKISFFLLASIDAVFRNLIHPFRKKYSQKISLIERLLKYFGFIKDINQMRDRAVKTN